MLAAQDQDVATPPASRDATVSEIRFPNDHGARLVFSPSGADPAATLAALGMPQPQALIMIVGGADELDEALRARLIQLFSRGIARAAAETGALIIDGGTDSGVMAMMGQGVADRGRKSSLLGVAPAGKVVYPGSPAEAASDDVSPLDPNHSHFVLVESDEWGGEIGVRYALAETLARGIRAVTVLVNGGPIARDEVLRSVRQGWPIIVVEGSGRLADEIAGLRRERPRHIEDPVLAEIVEDGEIQLVPPGVPAEAVRRLIAQQFSPYTTLRLVWECFARFDANANRLQAGFDGLQLAILALGVLGTLLVLAQTQWADWGLKDASSGSFWWAAQPLHVLIVLVPITTSVLLAASNRFKLGQKWVLLRGSAEAIKREIFRYRVRAGIYSDGRTRRTSREVKLARRVEAIGRRLMQTEVNLSALRPYEGPIPPKLFGADPSDDGLSRLTPDRYVALRLVDQITYYRRKTNELERRLQRLQWLIYIVGGVGTLVAALGFGLWIALTTALVGAFTTYLEYRQVETTLTKYSQAETDLAGIQAWWNALSAEEQADQKNVDRLVDYTERTLEGELAGWVQQMHDAVADLDAQQAGDESSGDDDA